MGVELPQNSVRTPQLEVTRWIRGMYISLPRGITEQAEIPVHGCICANCRHLNFSFRVEAKRICLSRACQNSRSSSLDQTCQVLTLVPTP
ncbi:hypothetical protein PAXRUDRAFT_630798 [Paxillus rubicundulus Ve08.2h10]|uniref:Uncharacterized protein n=1 Tax=Paxillus rubicundulus Ve08.2h10 TaxID=930991 RepID=A0A0D0DY51_9AGAM|nr:hypothetical protein PAXRUDRAFT_630798 [Paxillus rubicundulus Ve08.2h10]